MEKKSFGCALEQVGSLYECVTERERERERDHPLSRFYLPLYSIQSIRNPCPHIADLPFNLSYRTVEFTGNHLLFVIWQK